MLAKNTPDKYRKNRKNNKFRQFSTMRETVRVYLNYVCLRFDQILLHHLHVHSRYYSDIRWNTRAFVATSHAYQYVEQRHTKNVDRLWENLAIQFINCC